MAMTTILQLPYPPSANNLFINARRGRAKSPRYREWEGRALDAIRTQLPVIHTIKGAYHLLIRMTAPDRRRRDLDNMTKAISDLLVTARVIADDCNAQVINLHRSADIIKGGAVEVIVSEVSA